ncbi:TPA: cyclic nucleotide-binding domain-containing protein, partial [Vibrio cholerae]
MDAELIEIQQFLQQHPPFDALPNERLPEIAQQIEIAYFRKDTPIIGYKQAISDLYLVRSGAVEVYRRHGELYNRLTEGSLFGQMGLLTRNQVSFAV